MKSRDKEWSLYTPEYLSKRYNYIAPIYPFFEKIFLLPVSIRKKAVDALDLNEGDNVLEIGSGTGRNLALLSAAVGKGGRVFGIDISEGMMKKAMHVKVMNSLTNVELSLTDALAFQPERKINAVLFSLSYATMIHRREVLMNVWNILEPGGRVVIMDAQYPPGVTGKLMTPVKPFITMFLKASVLGNPHIKITNELAEITGREPIVTEHSMKTYFIAAAIK